MQSGAIFSLLLHSPFPSDISDISLDDVTEVFVLNILSENLFMYESAPGRAKQNLSVAYDFFPRAVSHPKAPGWLLMFSGGWTPFCSSSFRAKPARSTLQPNSYAEAPSSQSHFEALTLQCQALVHSKPDDFLAPHGSLVAHFQLCCCTRGNLSFSLICCTYIPIYLLEKTSMFPLGWRREII